MSKILIQITAGLQQLIPHRYFVAKPAATVKIFVGPEKKLWVLPEDLLCDRIEFFRAAFKSKFKEGISKEMFLESDDSTAFGRLVDWIFNEDIKCEIIHKFHVQDAEHELEWLRLWILADKLGLQRLQDCCRHAYESCLYEIGIHPAAEAVSFVYENTEPNSELRQMLVDKALGYFLAPSYSRKGFRIEDFAAATSSNATYNLAVTTAIVGHMEEPKCIVPHCQMHKREKELAAKRDAW
jgi:hypothetical protein